MAVVNILYAMLKSSGLEEQALWLMRRTWRRYRSGEDTQGASYHRYNFNYGVSLLERGFLRNPVALDEDMGNLPEWKEHADQNAYEHLARSYEHGGLPAAGGWLTALLAMRGEVGRAIAVGEEATHRALAAGSGLVLCDVAIACAAVYDIVQLFGPPIEQFRRCRAIAASLGDEPRRAALCALLARFLTYAGRFDEADACLAEADAVADRLDLGAVRRAARAARGVWLADSGASPEEAVRVLRTVADELGARDDVPLFVKIDALQPDAAPRAVRGIDPMLCRVQLDLARAALLAGHSDVLNDALDELATEAFPGYCPHYYLTHAQALLLHGDDAQRALAAELLERAAALGRQQGNAWPEQAAAALRGTLG